MQGIEREVLRAFLFSYAPNPDYPNCLLTRSLLQTSVFASTGPSLFLRLSESTTKPQCVTQHYNCFLDC